MEHLFIQILSAVWTILFTGSVKSTSARFLCKFSSVWDSLFPRIIAVRHKFPIVEIQKRMKG